DVLWRGGSWSSSFSPSQGNQGSGVIRLRKVLPMKSVVELLCVMCCSTVQRPYVCMFVCLRVTGSSSYRTTGAKLGKGQNPRIGGGAGILVFLRGSRENLLIQSGWINWKRMLAYVTGSVDEQLLLRNEYFITENRILRNQIKD